MADTANTTMIRVRRDAQALVRDLGEKLGAPSLTDLATALIRLGARRTDKEIAAELAALPAVGADRGPDGLFRKSSTDP